MAHGHQDYKMSRDAWYDRNPVSTPKYFFQGNINPHAVEVVRWTYTVPTDKKAMIEAAFTDIVRSVAAPAAAVVFVTVKYTISGGSGLYLTYTRLIDMAVGARDKSGIGQSATMYEGDKLEGTTVDGSAGGKTDINVSAKLVEFDA